MNKEIVTSKKSFFDPIASYVKDIGNLLRLDFYRALKDKSVIIIASIVAAYALLEVLLGYLLDVIGATLFTARDIVVIATQLSNMPFLVISVLLCIFIGKDLNYGTIRNKIIAGYSKKQIYVSTLVVALILAFGLLIVYQGLAYLVGTPALGFPTGLPYPPVSDFWVRLGLGYLLIAMAVSIVVFVELTTRNMTAALLVSTIAFTVGPVASYFLGLMLQNQLGSTSILFEIFECFFFYDSYMISSAGSFNGIGLVASLETQLALKTLISTGVSLVLLNWLGIYVFHKLDLK